MKIYLIILLLNIPVGDIGETVQGVLSQWLEYTPSEMTFSVITETEPNEPQTRYYHIALEVQHLKGGYGITYREPNDQADTYIYFQRFSGEQSGGVEPVMLLKNVRFYMQCGNNLGYYDRDAIDNWIMFNDSWGRETVIMFHEIKWVRVNMFMYAEAAKGR